MARQASEIQQHEIQAYQNFCNEHGIIHDGSADDHANGELVLRYFCETWPNIISHQTLTQAFPQLKPHLRFKSAARVQAERVARENSTVAQKFGEWFDHQKMLVKEGDSGYRNYALLLNEMRGHEMIPQRIHEAMGRLNHRVGQQLVYVTKQKPQDDLSTYKPGRFVTDFNVSPVEHARRAREAYADKQESTAVISQREQFTAKSEAESLRGRSHSENDQLERVFVTDPKSNQIDWIATRNARIQLQKQFERRHAVARRQA
jgi:hypothetical protein